MQKFPPEIKQVVPRWDQVFLEAFHTGYVDGLSIEECDRILNLTRVRGEKQ